ncbi:MAG: uroporphyrinogen decarboxylase family protein [bacterium]
MRPRERFERIMNHREADRVPLDLAGTSLSTTYGRGMERLREFLGFTGPDTSGYEKFDERILRYFDIDFRRVGNIISFQRSLRRKISDTEYIDDWGIRRAFTGQYWEIVESPLRGATVEDLKRYPWPDSESIDEREIERFRAQAKHLYEETDRVVVGEHPVLGILELGCWMCGFDDFLIKMALDETFVRTFFDIYLDIQKKVIEIYYGAIGEYIHITTSGDDFGTQRGPFISPEMYRRMIKPYFKERIEFTKRFTKAYYWHHSCGAISPLIDDLIDTGVEILNPIQPLADGMDPRNLKERFGDRICFHGGIDTQYLLPRGSPEEVEERVRNTISILGKGGGYILAAAHNIQEDVPPENIAAMFLAGRK